jgi:hypothetical protein
MYLGWFRTMRSSRFKFGLCLALSSVGVLFSAEAISSPLSPQRSDGQLLAQTDTVTLLRFETQHYLVRVFRRAEQTFLNVYNKETGFTDKNQVPAIVAPPEDDEDNWRTYMNQQGDLEYRARVNPEGQTELEIRMAGGSPTQAEPGFNATYSFPHMYLGADLATTLETLQASGWVIDSTESQIVELTRNQLSLDLTFDPDTQVIISTRLI